MNIKLFSVLGMLLNSLAMPLWAQVPRGDVPAAVEKADQAPLRRGLGDPPQRIDPPKGGAGSAPKREFVPISQPPQGVLGTAPPAGPPIGTAPPTGKPPLGEPAKKSEGPPPK